jgi:hypothetical protein
LAVINESSFLIVILNLEQLEKITEALYRLSRLRMITGYRILHIMSLDSMLWGFFEQIILLVQMVVKIRDVDIFLSHIIVSFSLMFLNAADNICILCICIQIIVLID